MRSGVDGGIMVKCGAPQCDKPVWRGNRSWCTMHYGRARRGQDMNAPRRRNSTVGVICLIEGCNIASRSRGYCKLHYSKALASGDVRSTHSFDLEDICSYRSAHRRVHSAFGPARLYPCVKCGNASHDWAYDGMDATQLLGKGTGSAMSWYSRYPEFYMPLCRPCHRALDGNTQATELNEYRRAMAQQNGWQVVE